MNTEFDLALLIVAMLIFGIVSATSAAMRILAYGYAGRNGEDKEENGAYPNRLLEDAVPNYFALGIGRAVGFGDPNVRDTLQVRFGILPRRHPVKDAP